MNAVRSRRPPTGRIAPAPEQATPPTPGAGALSEREALVTAAEAALQQRERALEQRELAVQTREELANEQALRRIHTETQLREANEHLVLASLRAQTKTEAAETATAQMSFLAEHDFLTGLPNRSLLLDRLAQSITLARRHGTKIALMYLDLDHFKEINDSLGHPAGDQLLQSTAQRLQTCVRNSDTVSRLGGDEFVLLLSDIDTAQDTILTAEKLIASMAAPHAIAGHQLHVTLSIGISLFPDDGQDVDSMLKNADTAMYHAKRSGRNRYQLFAPTMNFRQAERRSGTPSEHAPPL
ncbi:diguanylate cyclase [Rhodocyclus tenuis]|uniref:Diguanylate cyclase n=2 Tax=Rhodocyclus TaxID=1064 RepID=A0A6L5JT17_RHOTE|nr:GGDEF domain-containing protein [Rhodocyclus gracilis]MQY50523.1 diguanylate cyclase [Rhodocyclus gracilis]NJA88027.1 diguanylate cyclase [Rhodocyclus gracilis]